MSRPQISLFHTLIILAKIVGNQNNYSYKYILYLYIYVEGWGDNRRDPLWRGEKETRKKLGVFWWGAHSPPSKAMEKYTSGNRIKKTVKGGGLKLGG